MPCFRWQCNFRLLDQRKQILRYLLSILLSGCLLISLFSCRHASAQDVPLWELGLGTAGVSIPHYRGADQRSYRLLPLPYLVYRGNILRADRDGVRGLLLESERLSLSISANGSLPVDSSDNEARRGMRELEPTVEVGPTLITRLWSPGSDGPRLDLRAPIRTAITVESSPRQIGWVFSPTLSLAWANPAGYAGWNANLHLGPIFATRRYHRYFYTVERSESRPDRPAYQAPGGYSGSQALITLGKRLPDFWIGAFIRYDRLHGAQFASSPLVQRNDAWSAGLGISWIFSRSDQKVSATWMDP